MWIIITIAIILVIGAALLAYLIFVNEPKTRTLASGPPAPPKPVEAFVAEPIEAWDQVEPTRPLRERPRGRGPSRPKTLDDAAIGSGLARMQTGFNECARAHGAVDGSLVRVGFSATAEGQVQGAFALAPHARTPLGRCIVDVVSRTRLRRTELGRGDVRWSIVLHP